MFAEGLALAGQALGLFSSAKSVFGSDEPEGISNKEYRKQLNWQLAQARELPANQVVGLRNAGLNPMLAATKGLPPGAPFSNEPGLTTKLSTAKQVASQQGLVATAQVANLNANSAKNLADADLAKAQAETERNRPENVRGQTEAYGAQATQSRAQAALADMQRNLTEQNWKTEGFTTKIRELEHAFQAENYGNRVNLAKTELARARAELMSAQTRADVDRALLRYERIAAMAKDASGAVSGLIPWGRLFAPSSAKAIRRQLPQGR